MWSSQCFGVPAVSEYARNHKASLLGQLPRINLASPVGAAALELISAQPSGFSQLQNLYRNSTDEQARIRIVTAMKSKPSAETAAFLRAIYDAELSAQLRNALQLAIAAQSPDTLNESILLEALKNRDGSVARECAAAYARLPVKPSAELSSLLLSRMKERRGMFRAMELVLVRISGQKPEGHDPSISIHEGVPPAEVDARLKFWEQWHTTKFGAPATAVATTEKTDEQIHAFILNAKLDAGNATRGLRMYERLQCNACHGGGQTPGQEGRLFGPELTGVAQRLTRPELADSLVYPSKQVPDRFKAQLLELADGREITGFLTDRSNGFVTFAEQLQVHRVPEAQVKKLEPQDSSLMPQGLLNTLSNEELEDLLTFLNGPPK